MRRVALVPDGDALTELNVWNYVVLPLTLSENQCKDGPLG